MYRHPGKRKKAEKIFLEICNISGDAAFNLAVMRKQDGNPERAEELYWKAHLMGQLQATYNLGNHYAKRREWHKSEDMFLHCIEQYEMDQGDDLQDLLGFSMFNLGNAYREQSKWSMAVALHLRAYHAGCADVASKNIHHLLLEIFWHEGRNSQEAILSCIAELSLTDQNIVFDAIEKALVCSGSLQSEDLVEIVGLQNDAGQMLNRRQGRVLFAVPSKDRIAVAVDGGGKKLIKPVNLRRLPTPKTSRWKPSSKSPIQSHDEDVLHHVADSPLQHNAQLMDAIMRSARSVDLTTIAILEYS